jgi:hypothetical protein
MPAADLGCIVIGRTESDLDDHVTYIFNFFFFFLSIS